MDEFYLNDDQKQVYCNRERLKDLLLAKNPSHGVQ
jgi:hypothetical protein